MTFNAIVNFIIFIPDRGIVRLDFVTSTRRDAEHLRELEHENLRFKSSGGLNTRAWVPNARLDWDGTPQGWALIVYTKTWPELARLKGALIRKLCCFTLERMQRELFHVEPDEIASFINQRSKERRAS